MQFYKKKVFYEFFENKPYRKNMGMAGEVIDGYEQAKKFYTVSNLNLANITPKSYISSTEGTYKNLYQPDSYTKQTGDYRFFVENQHLTLDSSVDLFQGFNSRPYDVPERFAIMADNSLRKTGNAYICDRVPEIFKGIDKAVLMNALSKFAIADKKPNSLKRFKIGDKEIIANPIISGSYGSTYEQTDSSGNSVCIKIFDIEDNLMLEKCGGICEIATSRQLSRDSVVDVPKFYMANAGSYRFGKNRTMYMDYPWLVVDYIDDDKVPPEEGTKLAEWMKSHFMKHYDDSFQNRNMCGKYVLDLGGILPIPKYKYFKTGLFNYKTSFGESEYKRNVFDMFLELSLKSGMGVNEILETLK